MILILVLTTIVNRMSGDDRWMRSGETDPLTGLKPKWLAGRPLIYTSLCMALIAGLAHLPEVAVGFGLAYYLWRVLAWGRWFDLGRLPDGYNRVGIDPDPYERLIIWISRGDDYLALFCRHLMVVPGLAIISLLTWSIWPLIISPVFALALTVAYEVGWRLRPQEPILVAELICGALWGVLIVSV